MEDILKPGLYFLLNTPEIQHKIELIQKRAVFEKAEPVQISRLIARTISEEIEKYLRDKLEKADNKDNRTSDWVNKELNGLSSSYEIEKFINDALPIDENILTEIKSTPEAVKTERPTIALTESELIVPDGRSPQLGNEIVKELKSAETAAWLVSFIKLKAIRGLYSELQKFCGKENENGEPRLKIATTTYIGATDLEALKLLFKLPNTEIKVCFNSSQTRLHAKAYIFSRRTKFGSAYVGSANLSVPALSSGMEWTVKIAQNEIPHLYERACLSFETCWNDPNFETCTEADIPRIQSALKAGKITVRQKSERNESTHKTLILQHYEPHYYQRQMLDELNAERTSGYHRHLIVSATGTGKTIVAAFDYAQEIKRMHKNPSLLYLVHRTDILNQAREKYRMVLEQDSFGALIGEGTYDSTTMRQCFCTVQSWKNHVKGKFAEKFDLIVMDECHHSAAKSYLEVIEYYKTDIDSGITDLLGLTATPFRGDGEDIRPYFGGEFTHNLPLSEAIENGHIVPFTYFGVDDDTDFTSVEWGNRNKAEKQVSEILGNSIPHLNSIVSNIGKYIPDIQEMRAIGFCAGIQHANTVAAHLNKNGINAVVLTGDSSIDDRKQALDKISKPVPEVNIILTANLFNEGVDIPCINTELMLRPTNSPLIFVQQLGRGLRKAPLQYDKSDLVVLDFVGNHNKNYSGFMHRFRAMSTRPEIPLNKQISEGMPFLPAGCSVSLSEKSRKEIISNINSWLNSLRGNALKKFIIQEIITDNKPLDIKSIMERLGCESPAPVYRVGIPSELAEEALNSNKCTSEIGKSLNVLAQNDSPLMVKYWKKILYGNTADMSETDIKTAKFFMLTAFDNSARMSNVEENWEIIMNRKGLINDLLDFLDWRYHHIQPMISRTFVDKTSKYLELHRNYNSQQICAALGRDGYVIQSGTFNANNVDSFFITRIKDERDFSPTTMYEDYAKTPKIFHWQSPSRTTLNSDDGQRYINGKSTKMLFLRQTKRRKIDCTGIYTVDPQTSTYIFLGPVKKVISYEGESPISFDFELEYEMPADVFEFARGA